MSDEVDIRDYFAPLALPTTTEIEFAELARLRRIVAAATATAFVAWVTECRPDMESDVEFCEAKALSNRGAAARRKLAAIDVFLAAVAANGPTEADPDA